MTTKIDLQVLDVVNYQKQNLMLKANLEMLYSYLPEKESKSREMGKMELFN